MVLAAYPALKKCGVSKPYPNELPGGNLGHALVVAGHEVGAGRQTVFRGSRVLYGKSQTKNEQQSELGFPP